MNIYSKNPNWGRWIYANIVNYFSEISGKIPLPFYLDRYDRDTDWAELRFGGPHISQPSKSYFLININIDILITCFINNDRYRIHRLTGMYESAFQPLCLYKYGDGPDDDHSFFGTLLLKDDPINVTNYGLIYPDQKFVRSSVETDFYVCIDR